jgi:4-hydroxy-2-oxoheptanedioate aldolase
MIALIQRIADVCKANNIKACLHCGTPEYAAKAISWGYDLTTVGGDSRFLAAAASASVLAWRDLMESNPTVQDDTDTRRDTSAGGY